MYRVANEENIKADE